MVHPCCGTSLQQGTKFLAMFSMMLSVVGIGGSSFYLFTVLLSSPKRDSSSGSSIPDGFEPKEDFTSMVIKVFITLILFIFNLFLSILLFIGAEQKNLRLCEVWYKVTILLFIIDMVMFIGSIGKGVAEVPDIVIYTSGIIYSLYELWVVHAFIKEMRSQKEAALGCLTVNTTV